MTRFIARTLIFFTLGHQISVVIFRHGLEKILSRVGMTVDRLLGAFGSNILSMGLDSVE